MLNVSHLLANVASFGDRLRYTPRSVGQRHGTHDGAGPVVVWNITRTCNLRCLHCYASSENKKYDGELTTEEALAVIDDLVAARVPVILFSGGEPFVRPDILDLARYAVEKGIHVTFSTNGTLIDEELAKAIKAIGVGYVGISLDGIGDVHDRFRRKKGAFDAALRGIRNCLNHGVKVGLRFTINRHNVDQLEAIFNLIEEEGIPRACFYHLVYTGRASAADDITPEETREVLDSLFARVEDFARRGNRKEILTVDNHADGAYLYLRMKEKDPAKAEAIYEKLRYAGGNRSGMAIANIDHRGFVHPDQFTPYVTVGNVRETPFSVLWRDNPHPMLEKLRNRKSLLTGRCSRCRFLDICNGNFRARAMAVHGDFWAEDPACFLTDEEIFEGRQEN